MKLIQGSFTQKIEGNEIRYLEASSSTLGILVSLEVIFFETVILDIFSSLYFVESFF